MNIAHNATENKKNNEFYLSLFVIATLAYNLVTETVNILVNLVLPNTPLDTAICLAVYLFLLYKALPALLPRIKLADILVLMVSLILFGIAMLNDGTAQYSMTLLPTFIIQMYPLYILGRTVSDIESIEKIFYKSLPVIVIVAALNTYYNVFVADSTQITDNMSFAYYILPFSLMALFALLNKFSLRNVSLFLIIFVAQVLSGTRGPLLCLAIAAVLYILLGNMNYRIKLLFVVAMGLIAVYFLSDLFVENMMEISAWFKEQGISNRILDMLLEEDIANSTGRNNLNEAIIAAIEESPLFGKGFLGDRAILNGTYVHNIFFELVCHFGIVIGVIAFCAIVITSLRMLFKNKQHMAWAVMLVSAGLIKLFLSSSYVQEQMFFLMIGFCFNSYSKKVQ